PTSSLPPFPTRRSSDLGNDAVSPIVAEVVDAAEGLFLPRRGKDIGQRSLISASRAVAPFVLGNMASPGEAPRHKLVEMSILPSRSEEHTSELQSRSDLV